MERILLMSCIINEHILLPSLFYVIEMFPDPFFCNRPRRKREDFYLL